MKVKQTAGRDQLGDFAPQFAQLNDDILFGEVWSGNGLSLKLRSILTVTVLVSKGMIDNSFQFHIENAKKNGVAKREMADILTHVAFYAGWPNAWAAFRAAVEVYKDDPGADGGMFGLGQPNDAYARYFIGNSYLNPLTDPEATSRLNRAAATIGTSTTRRKVADKSYFAPMAAAGIRNGARTPGSCIPATWSIFPQK